MTGALEAQAYGVLASLAALLLLFVTGGVIYLTAIEWQDKRKRSQEALDNRVPVRNKRKRSQEASDSRTPARNKRKGKK
ncbi:hypothetical protein D0962_09940 [Leptolyngbyaceae cyanobacterium CCMR0082]|uniref:Uncharacterized protein n=2 Tax=Adonisia turfae TaxID=2950184 RepID=A0A6M0S3M0_9CYAN|nr:hypothetical protein [Adonisia turfae]MDV3351632.1 hypothetical protein [Leptothoe sp. LEGE 181152]NEZ55104.1 hypothetical protein [Adonisia turfae CCMR0081]NEZ63097.1 hypothetical protein [Adonisia turfae CCMR0082]